MIMLIYEEDYERVRRRLLEQRFSSVCPLIVSRDGAIVFEGKPVQPDMVEPEIVWITRAVFDDGPAEFFLEKALQGPDVRWIQTFNAGLDASFRKLQAYGIGFSEKAQKAAEQLGFDTSVFEAMLNRGRRLCNSNAMGAPIAEYVMAQLFAEWYPIKEQRAAQADHQWKHVPFREIAGSRWLILGYGNNGREIARRAKAFDAYITATRRNPVADEHADRVVTNEEGVKELERADVVVLAFPLSAETADFADDRFFERMKAGAILINVSRGGLIDEAALFRALDRKAPRIAILDAFRKEPLPPGDPLWDHPGIRLTAHCSWAGDGVVARNDTLFLDNLDRFIRKQPLVSEVGPAHFQNLGR